MPLPASKDDYSTTYPDGETSTVLGGSSPKLADRLDRLEVGADGIQDTIGVSGDTDPTTIDYRLTAAAAAASAAGSNLAAHTADATDAHDASAISILDAFNLFSATEVETALTEIMARVVRVEEHGYPVRNGIPGTAGTQPVIPSDSAATQRANLQAIVDHFQALGTPVSLLYTPGQQYEIARDAGTACGIVHSHESWVTHETRVGGPLAARVQFTSTTANDTAFAWLGEDNADYSNRCRHGGFRNMNIQSATANAETRGVWFYGADAMLLDHFTAFAFGYEGFLGTHYTDSETQFVAFDHCGTRAGRYAYTLASGFNWGCDSIDNIHMRFEQCQRDIKIAAGLKSLNRIYWTNVLKLEHAEEINHLEPLVLLDGGSGSPGTAVEDIQFHAGFLHVDDAAAALDYLILADSVGALGIYGMYLGMGPNQVADAWLAIQDCKSPTLLGVRGNVGNTAARPPNGIVQIRGDVDGMNQGMDVEWNWNGSGYGSGGTYDPDPATGTYGDSAPYAVTLASAATLSYAPSVINNIDYPPTV